MIVLTLICRAATMSMIVRHFIEPATFGFNFCLWSYRRTTGMRCTLMTWNSQLWCRAAGRPTYTQNTAFDIDVSCRRLVSVTVNSNESQTAVECKKTWKCQSYRPLSNSVRVYRCAISWQSCVDIALLQGLPHKRLLRGWRCQMESLNVWDIKLQKENAIWN